MLLTSTSNCVTSTDFRNPLKELKSTICDGRRFQIFTTRSQKYVELSEELLNFQTVCKDDHEHCSITEKNRLCLHA